MVNALNLSETRYFDIMTVMRRIFYLFLATTLLCGTFATSNAADIRIFRSKDWPEVPYITIYGTIHAGDEETFHATALSFKKAIVDLNSDGGDVKAALAIGAWISINNLATSVAPHSTCASACALIWVAGHHRYTSDSASIGFHAAYTVGPNGNRESGMFNAEIGAYLTYLGLSLEAVKFITEASPENIKWLHVEEAKRLGITMELTPE